MMIKTPPVPEKIHKVICNMCGESCTYMKVVHNYATVTTHFGYGTDFDGYSIEDIHLCEKCYVRLESMLQIKPKKIDLDDWSEAYEDYQKQRGN